MTYKVALSSMTLTGKIPPGDPLLAPVQSFRNVELDTYQHWRARACTRAGR